LALREVRILPDPILRQKSKPVEKITSKIIELLEDMHETMIEKNGIGIAAPQVGTLKRVIIVDTGDDYTEMINPELIETKGLVIGLEGCLSIPDKTGYVRRPHFVKMKGLDRTGKEIEIEATGLKAVALCHELDHLNGVLYIDREVIPTEAEQAILDKSKDDLVETDNTQKNDE